MAALVFIFTWAIFIYVSTLCADDELSSTQETMGPRKTLLPWLQTWELHSVTLNWSRTLFRPPGTLCTKAGQTSLNLAIASFHFTKATKSDPNNNMGHPDQHHKRLAAESANGAAKPCSPSLQSNLYP